MIIKVSKTVSAYKMLEKGQRVLVGLSGGADSVSLSLCLKALGYDVACVHINHCLRGSESDRDESFCAELCERMGFELRCFRVNVAQYCEENKVSTELGARQLRYECFEKAACELNCNKIATAHTLSDCLETTLMNLVRGCGIKGICGIPPVRGKYIRPLIECTREEIEGYLESAGEKYVTDSTNLLPDCTRNIIRQNVVPQLKSINEGLYRSYQSTVRNLRRSDEFLEKLCSQSINKAKISDTSYDVHALTEHGSPISEMAISALMKQACGESSSDRIGDVMRIIAVGGKVTLRGNVYASVKNNVLAFSRDAEEIGEYEVPISVGGEVEVFGKILKAAKVAADDIVNKKFTKYDIDYDKIKGDIFVRNRRRGDKVKLSGRNITSSVKSLFNADIPRDERDKVLFLCDEQGIIFIEGYGCAERVKCQRFTKNLLRISVEPVTGLSQ